MFEIIDINKSWLTPFKQTLKIRCNEDYTDTLQYTQTSYYRGSTRRRERTICIDKGDIFFVDVKRKHRWNVGDKMSFLKFIKLYGSYNIPYANDQEI